MSAESERNTPTEWARQALLAMRERHIAPTPENYLVWYTVAADRDAALSRLVRVLDDQSAPYDEIRNWEIYNRFFSSDHERHQLRGLGDRVEVHLDAIGDLVGHILAGTQAYGAQLGDAVERIPQSTGLAELNQALSTLRADTQQILNRADQWSNTASSQADEVTKLKADLDAARNEAETDALTQIGNRKRFERRLRELAAAACEKGTALSLILIDVDHFKSFNDTYGHALGDRVLKLVAQRVNHLLDDGHEVARYGGEEFAVITPGVDIGNAVDIAEAIRKAVASLRVARKSDSEPLRRVTVSLGVAQYSLGEPLSRLAGRADGALYAAKASGRNCTSIKRAKPCTAEGPSQRAPRESVAPQC